MIEIKQQPISLETIRRLFPNAEWLGETRTQYTSVSDDSRTVTEGGIFVACQGYETDGHLFLYKAQEKGAGLLIVERNHVRTNPDLISHLQSASLLLVDNTRRALSVLASEAYGNPSRLINVHGITGTKGKTSTVHMCEAIFKEAGRNPALIGTLGVELGNEKWSTKLTTPGSIEFQKWLRFLLEKGATDIICEVTAHSGALARTFSVHFASVTYLNLSRDHGDHFSENEYIEAKMTISRDAVGINPNVWVLGNIRDPHTERFLGSADKTRQFRFAAYEEHETPLDGECDLVCRITSKSFTGMVLALESKYCHDSINLPLIGRFNAQNAAAASSIAVIAGIPSAAISAGLSNLPQIPGRLERIDNGQNFLVIVDYAHAPEPAREILIALREITQGKLIGVMGAGGSRDRGKRPMIGEVLAQYCDLAVITSDNPRDEEPLDIINDILVGVQRIPEGSQKVKVEADRRNAIYLALENAKKGDTVAVLGKGHENYQIFKDKTIPFDDREVVREWLIEHGYRRKS